MPGAPKLLLPLGGRPLLRWAAEALVEGGLAPVVAVAGVDADGVVRALKGLPARVIQNPRCAEGVGTSIAAGIRALQADEVNAVAIALGDMPLLSATTVRSLAAAFLTGEGSIVVPLRRGRRGHPVLFDLARHRTALLALRGDQGARAILADLAAETVGIPVDDDGVLVDVDGPEDYRAVRERFNG
ncbi:MAG: nucleotidyltransferase family protein [Deltaproteobacteria bacterium]|nr:nucleotidyltransferase family protein [Deltaproteobacteria bacterium]